MIDLIKCIIVGALLLGLSVAPFGVYAFDRGLYFEADNGRETGLYYTVKRDRSLGPDRILFRSTIAQEAWAVFEAFQRMDDPPKLFNFVQPTPEDGS